MIKKYPVFIVLLFVVVILLSLFIIIFFSKEKYNYDLIQVDYKTSTKIEIKNKLPVSDSIGKTYTGKGTSDGILDYVELSLTNPNHVSISYDIYITEDTSNDSSRIKGNYIKLFLTDGSEVPFEGFTSRKIPTFADLSVLNDKPGSKLLYRGYLNPEEVKIVKLRVWLSDSYSISASSREKEFLAEVNVRDNRRVYEG